MRVPVLRPLLTDARGYGLIELLVVVLIVGILALIALPAFLGQRMNAQDAEAQATVRTVAVALAAHESDAETFDATRAQLAAIEPAIGEASASLAVTGTASTYEITETSVSGTTFTLRRAADGRITRSCSVAERGRCRAGNTW